MKPAVGMGGQTQKSDAQADDRRDRPKGKDVDQWAVHLIEVERNRLTVRTDVLQRGVIAGPNALSRQAQADQRGRHDDRSAQWSHDSSPSARSAEKLAVTCQATSTDR